MMSMQQFLQFAHAGTTREYLLYQPADLPPHAPVVFVLHGYTDNAAKTRTFSHMDAIADRYGFAVVYPQGTKDQQGKRFWQVGYAFHANETINDVDFLVALAHHVQTTHQFAPQHTYMTGMSNGGDMAYLMACQRPDVFTAIAPVVGTMMQWLYDAYPNPQPIPILAFNGTADTVTNYAGDPHNTGGWGAYLGVAAIMAYWQRAHGAGASHVDIIQGPDGTDPRHVAHHQYDTGHTSSQLQLYQVIGGGHDWSGGTDTLFVDASDVIGQFFMQQARSNQ